MSFVSIAPLDAVKPEGNSGVTSYTFTVTRSGDVSLEQSVQWNVRLLNFFRLPEDFDMAGALDFAPGETSKTIAIPVHGDTLFNVDQLFRVTLTDPSAGLLIGTATADGRVANDDVRLHDDAFIATSGDTLHVPATAPTSSIDTGGVWLVSSGQGAPPVLGSFVPSWDPSWEGALPVQGGTRGLGGVLANDATTFPLTASLVQGPAHGSLVFASDGHFDYTPDAGFVGIDRFTYSVDGFEAAGERQALIYVVPQHEGESTTLNLVALTAEEQIAATYVAFFGRGADAPGFDFWIDQFHTGQATQGPATLLANIASSFAISAEAAGIYPFLADPFPTLSIGPGGAPVDRIGRFLDSVYMNLFNRKTDDAGRTYWADQIAQTLAKGEFVGSVLVDIMSGAQNAPGHQDISTLMGKVAVGLAWVHEQQTLGPEWTPDLAAAKAVLQGVTDDPGVVLLGVAFAHNVIAHHLTVFNFTPIVFGSP